MSRAIEIRDVPLMDERAEVVPAATIVDVATRAGVSISSVSAALNGKPGVSLATRQRIRAIADEMGFVPSFRARSLSSKRTFALGLILRRNAAVLEEDPFFASFIGGIESVLSQREYALVLQLSSDSDATLRGYRDMIAGKRVDGVFLSELEVDDRRVQLVRELRTPAVAINADRGPLPIAAVRQDHTGGIEQLVTYLAGVGHRRFAYLGGQPDLLHSQQRLQTWAGALADLGLPAGMTLDGDFGYHSGRVAAELVAASPQRPTAVVCANDLMAVGMITRLQELGLRVPQDVSVSGYDGIRLGEYLRPRLTTLRTSPFLLGSTAATLLLEQIDGQEVDDIDIDAAELLLRDSTGPVSAES